MAGKVKKKEDGLQSKTARASMRGSTGGKSDFSAAADAPRIVPLGGGSHAYILDPRDGRTRRYSVASQDFFEALAVLAEGGYGDRMRRDLADLAGRYPASGWGLALARYDGPAPAEAEAETAGDGESAEDAA